MSGADVDGGRPVSGADVRSDIEREFEEAKETARAYLRAVGVIGPDQFSAREFREYDEGIMRHAILNRGTGVVDLPNDPLAREAALLGIRYLRCGRDDKILETLIGNASMPANRAVLDVLKSETLALGEGHARTAASVGADEHEETMAAGAHAKLSDWDGR